MSGAAFSLPLEVSRPKYGNIKLVIRTSEFQKTSQLLQKVFRLSGISQKYNFLFALLAFQSRQTMCTGIQEAAAIGCEMKIGRLQQ